MCKCEGFSAEITWKWFRKILLVFGTFMDVIGLFLLAFRYQPIGLSILFIVIGSSVLSVYLLTSLDTVAQYFKKLGLPSRMNRPENQVTQESRPSGDGAAWDSGVYDIPTYEEVIGPMGQIFPGIWTVGDPDNKLPPYSEVIMVSETPCPAGTAPQLTTSLDRARLPVEEFRSSPNAVTGPAQVLSVLKPSKLPTGDRNTYELREATGRLALEKPRTPPPSYEDAIDDDVFYPLEWDSAGRPGKTEGV
ncbi:transmembrane protein 139-like [Ambystoma mexicanum]|uniref:transmembrane protein 139-like n=1 Tax=Ambystoma mexicanum TaxID=8296 RepID=UPI0037E92469